MKPFQDQMTDFDERRRAARISSEEVAKAADMSLATLSRWRRGHMVPGVDAWNKVNGVLDELIRQRAAELKGLSR